MFLKTKKYNLNADEVKIGNVHKQIIVTMLLGSTLMSYGLQNGWISPMKKVLQSDSSPTEKPLTDNQISWIAGSLPLSAVLGSYLYAYSADRYGRKITIIAMLIPQALCWIIKLMSTHFIAFIAARILAGLPAGGCFNVTSMYVNEISQANIRGMLVSLAMSFLNIGLLCVYAMGSYLDYYTILWIAVCLPIATIILLIPIAPESPGYLVKKGQLKEAANAIAYLRSLDAEDDIVKKELEYMKAKEESCKTDKDLQFFQILRNQAWRRGFFVGMFTLTMLNLNGSVSVNTYALTIMTQAGVTVNPELQTLCIPVIMLFGSLVSIVCVEKLGRKPILVGAFALSTVSQGCLGTTQLLSERFGVVVPSWVPVLAIAATVWSYASGLVPMLFVILSEMFTYQVRAKLTGTITMYGWLVTFLQIYSFLLISNNFGMYTTYYAFCIINLIAAVVTLIVVPETMGKNFEQIENMLVGNKL